MLSRCKTASLPILTLLLFCTTITSCAFPSDVSTPTPNPDSSPVAESDTESDRESDIEATPEELPSEVASPTEGALEINTGAVRVVAATLYSEPSQDARVMGKVAGGSKFEVVDGSQDDEWLLICCPLEGETPGWVQLHVVQLDESPSNAEAPADDAAQVARLVAEPITVTQPLTSALAISVTQPLSITQVISGTPVADAVATGASTSQADGLTVSVAADVLNLRGGPGTNYPTVGQASAGETFEIRGRNADASWWQLCCSGQSEAEFWVLAELMSSQLTQDAVQAQVAEAEIPPTPEAPPAPAPVAAASTGTGAGAGLPGGGGFGGPGGTNPLTGLGLPGGRGGQRPLIVCINNDFAARPQLGTSQADVMYEYLMEGYGITRFSGIYYGEDAAQIGPVRSARLINYYMGALYDAGLACSGASDGVRYLLKHEAPFPYMDVDLDDPSNTRYSVSIGSDYRTRLRTATGKLHQWLADWGVQRAPSLRGFTFGSAPGGGTPATSIAVPYPGGSQSGYQYDAGSGRYLRFLSGAAHVDGNSGAQLALDNVVVQYVTHEATDIVEDSLGSTSIRLNLFGSGRAIVFRDGQAFEATWRSESRGDLPRFYMQDGQEISLKPGKTWISIVPASYAISY